MGVDPRTPQKLNLATASLIDLNACITRDKIQHKNYVNIQIFPSTAVIVAVAGRTVNQFHDPGVKLPNKPLYSLRLRVTLHSCLSRAIYCTHERDPRRIEAMPSQSHSHVHGGAGHVHSHAHGVRDHGSHAGHAGHSHPTLEPSVLGWAMVATLGLVVAEIFGGVLGRSVALLNDAVHNLSDVPALGISYLAMRWAQRPADDEKTYGYHRAGILAAFTNATVLVLLSLWLGYEALQRFRSPVAVVESWMIWTSLAALAVNGGITLALVRGRGDLNLRSILVHNFGDALSNIAIIVGAIVIHMTGLRWIDPLLGVAIGLLVLWSSIGILRQSSHILLEGRPKGMSVEDVARVVLTVSGVQEVHDVHIWSLGDAHNALSLHARIPDMHLDECERILADIQGKVADKFGIGHTTVQLERAGLPAQSGYVMPEPFKKVESV